MRGSLIILNLFFLISSCKENDKNKIITNAYFKAIIDEKVNEKTISDKYAELSGNLTGKKELGMKENLKDETWL